MPATEAMPTSRRSPPAACMALTKGAKVAAMPKTLVSMMRRKVSRSSSHSVSVPADTPALAMTMSGTPKRAMKSAAAACSAGASVTSSG